MSWWNDRVTVGLLSADLTGTLEHLTSCGIQIHSCCFLSELEAGLTIAGRDLKRAEGICRERGDTLRQRQKMVRPGAVIGKRPILTAMAILYFLASLYLPGRVLFVQVIGNKSTPSKKIIEAAENCGLCFGASRRAVRSEKLKNALLDALPELQWAGVNTHGCVAKISVREGEMQDWPVDSSAFGHITAGLDGYILSATATRGTLVCSPGQAVSAGDLLISGYTDTGLTIRAEQAQGEIYAATARKLRVVTPVTSLHVTKTRDELKKLSLLIGKKRINLWKDSGFWDVTCDRMYEENYITLPGGFQLPFGWCVERSRIRELSEKGVSTENLEPLLRETGENYLKTQMVSGTIQNTGIFVSEGPGVMQMTGQYSCVEMIGFMQRLEIGE